MNGYCDNCGAGIGDDENGEDHNVYECNCCGYSNGYIGKHD